MLAWFFTPPVLWLGILVFLFLVLVIIFCNRIKDPKESIDDRKQKITSMIENVNSIVDLVILYSKVAAKHGIDSEETKWFKLFEVRPHTPFLAVGFIATITKSIADKGINVLVVSTYSKDYLLIKEEKSNYAIEALRELGFKLKVT